MCNWCWVMGEGRRIGDIVDVVVNDDDFTNIDIHEQRDLLLANAALNINKKL